MTRNSFKIAGFLLTIVVAPGCSALHPQEEAKLYVGSDRHVYLNDVRFSLERPNRSVFQRLLEERVFERPIGGELPAKEIDFFDQGTLLFTVIVDDGQVRSYSIVSAKLENRALQFSPLEVDVGFIQSNYANCKSSYTEGPSKVLVCDSIPGYSFFYSCPEQQRTGREVEVYIDCPVSEYLAIP